MAILKAAGVYRSTEELQQMAIRHRSLEILRSMGKITEEAFDAALSGDYRPLARCLG